MSTSSRDRCRAYRRRILELSQRGPAHVAPALSCVEIVDAIYQMKRESDPFILSKGHGCLAQYVVLEAQGMDISSFGGHPDYGSPGIFASTGSLGHGLGIGVGRAYAQRLKGGAADTYVLMSDGELQEGSTWEAAQMAANLGLSNLVLFVDLNDFGGLERISEAHPAVYPVADKFRSFGWWTAEVNGHDSIAITAAARRGAMKIPTVVICKTVKGKGVSFMESAPIWHYRSPNAVEYEAAMEAL